MQFNLYLDHVIIEWEGSNLLETSILTALLFAKDQVITISSVHSLQKLLHKLSATLSTYNLVICAAKTKVLALKGK
jgi:hypothetical protein